MDIPQLELKLIGMNREAFNFSEWENKWMAYSPEYFNKCRTRITLPNDTLVMFPEKQTTDRIFMLVPDNG